MTTREAAETTHTPGPWTADEQIDNRGWVAVNSNGAPIGWASWQHQRGITKANAALIAAAPEMLEALRWAARSEHHSACPIATGKGQRAINKDDCTCHVKAADTAIAKAMRRRDGKADSK